MGEQETSQAAGTRSSEVTIEQAMAVARVMINRNELKEAASVYRRILDASPEHPDALNHLGIVTCHLGDAGQGLDYVRRAAAVAPDNASIHNNLGNLLIETGDVEGAVKAYHRCVELDRDNPAALNNLGSILRAQGEFDHAEKLLRHALSVNPDHGPAHHNLGEVLVRSGRPKEAIDHFWKAVVKMPTHEFNPYFIALAYERTGQHDA